MTRKLVFALTVVGAIGMAAGCSKEDKSTPGATIPKGLYSNQSQYKGAMSAGGASKQSP